MIKETISFEGFDGKPQVENLRFNITKSELADNLDLEDDFRAVEEIFKGEQRELTRPEVKSILELVKRFMRLSYGELSDDGKRFRKSPEIYQAFTETAAYDAFLFSLFEDPAKGMNFLVSLFPKDLLEGAKKQMIESGQGDLVAVMDGPSSERVKAPAELTDAEKDLIRRADSNPTSLSHEELVKAMQLKNRL